MKFNEKSYKAQSQHWAEDGHSEERQKVHKTWFEEDTINYWRQFRMYDPVTNCLNATKNNSWLTIGDGRYGLDAITMIRSGYTNVSASDLYDGLLKESKANGLLHNIYKENAENLSFKDETFDYILCKEAFHHCPRPIIALYEMLRVAKEGVVLIEPQDPWIDCKLASGPRIPSWESDGNFVYSLSRRELEKVAYGINLSAIAFKNICDYYYPEMAFQKINSSIDEFEAAKNKILYFEDLALKGERHYDILYAVIFKSPPSIEVEELLKLHGYDFQRLQNNPYIR